jgi:hypothetical protein
MVKLSTRDPSLDT